MFVVKRASSAIRRTCARSQPATPTAWWRAVLPATRGLTNTITHIWGSKRSAVRPGPLSAGQPLLGLYRGVPMPRRSSTYSGVLPDKISIFRGRITRLTAGDADRLRREVRHVVLHEIAHHFGISDDRSIELDPY